MAEANATGGGDAPGRDLEDLLTELLEQRKNELKQVIAVVMSRGRRPSGLWDWKRQEAQFFRRTHRTIISLEWRLREERKRLEQREHEDSSAIPG